MDLPSVNDNKWRELVTGKIRPDFESFAFKILLGRLGIPVSDPVKISASVSEIHAFFERNQNLPSASKDLEKLFG